MDETGFAQKGKAKKVVAVAGSKNVWSKTADANFHLTIVAAVAANGFAVPPMFIVPGQRLNRDLMDDCCVDDAVVLTAQKGFMNAGLFLCWLEHFERSVPGNVKRPLLLVYDGYGSHYNKEIILRAIQLKVILCLLPANATHLIQPLDIAVFRPFKAILKKKINQYMIDHASTSFSKKEAIKISSEAWKEGVIKKSANIISGFKASGIYPCSYPKMQQRWKLYHNGGMMQGKIAEGIQPWIIHRETIRTEILNLPPVVD